MPTAEEVLRKAGVTPRFGTKDGKKPPSPWEDGKKESLSLNPFSDKGWSLNPFRLARQAGDVAYSIPGGLWQMAQQGARQAWNELGPSPDRLFGVGPVVRNFQNHAPGPGTTAATLAGFGLGPDEWRQQAIDRAPLTASFAESFQRTGGRIIHPSRYVTAANTNMLVPTLVEDAGNAAMVAGPVAGAIGAGSSRLASVAARAAEVAAASPADEAAAASAARLATAARVAEGAARGAEAARPWVSAPARTTFERLAPRVAGRVTPIIESTELGANAMKNVRDLRTNAQMRRAVRAQVEEPALQAMQAAREGRKLAERMRKVLGDDPDLQYATILADSQVAEVLRPVAEAVRNGTIAYDSPQVTSLLDELFGTEQVPQTVGADLAGRPTQRTLEVLDDYLSGRMDPELRAKFEEARGLNDRFRQRVEDIKLNADEYRLNPEQLGDEAMPSQVERTLDPLRAQVDKLRRIIFGKDGKGGLNARAQRAAAKVGDATAETIRPERTARAGVRLGESLGVMNLTAEQSNRLVAMLKDAGEMAAAAGIEGLGELRARLADLKKQYRAANAGDGPVTEQGLAAILDLEKQVEALQQAVDGYLAGRPDLSAKLAGYDQQVRRQANAENAAAQADVVAEQARQDVFRRGAEDYDLQRLFGDEPPPPTEPRPAPRPDEPGPTGPSVVERQRMQTATADAAPEELVRLFTAEETPNLPDLVRAADETPAKVETPEPAWTPEGARQRWPNAMGLMDRYAEAGGDWRPRPEGMTPKQFRTAFRRAVTALFGAAAREVLSKVEQSGEDPYDLNMHPEDAVLFAMTEMGAVNHEDESTWPILDALEANLATKIDGGGDTRSVGEQSPAAPGAGAVGVRADSPAGQPDDVADVRARRTEVQAKADEAVNRWAGAVDLWQVTPPFVFPKRSVPVSAAEYERHRFARGDDYFLDSKGKPRRYLDTSRAATWFRTKLTPHEQDTYLRFMSQQPDERLASLMRTGSSAVKGEQRRMLLEQRQGAELGLDELRQNGNRTREFDAPEEALADWLRTMGHVEAYRRMRTGALRDEDVRLIADDLGLDPAEVGMLFASGKAARFGNGDKIAKSVASEWRAWRAERDAEDATREREQIDAQEEAAAEDRANVTGTPAPEGLPSAWTHTYEDWLDMVTSVAEQVSEMVDEFGDPLPDADPELLAMGEQYLAHLDPYQLASREGYDAMLALYADERKGDLPGSLLEQSGEEPTPAYDPEKPATLEVPARRSTAVAKVMEAGDERLGKALRKALERAKARGKSVYLVDVPGDRIGDLRREVREVRPATGDFLEVRPDGSLLLYKPPAPDEGFVAGPPQQPPGGGGGGRTPPPGADEPPPPPEDEGPMFGPGRREAAGARAVGEAERRAAEAWQADEVTRKRAKLAGNRLNRKALRYVALTAEEKRLYRALAERARAIGSEELRRLIATDRLDEAFVRGEKAGYRSGRRAGRIEGRDAERRRLAGQALRRNSRERVRFERRLAELHKAIGADAKRAESVFTKKGTAAEKAARVADELTKAMDELDAAERKLRETEAKLRAGSIEFPEAVPGSWKPLLLIAKRHNAWVRSHVEYLRSVGLDSTAMEQWLMPETIEGWKARGIESPRYVPGARDQGTGSGMTAGGRNMLPRRGRPRSARMKEFGELPTDPRTMYRSWMDAVRRYADNTAQRQIAETWGHRAGDLVDQAIDALVRDRPEYQAILDELIADAGKDTPLSALMDPALERLAKEYPDAITPEVQRLIDMKRRGGADMAEYLKRRGFDAWNETGQTSIAAGHMVNADSVMMPEAIMREYARWYKPSSQHWAIRGYDYATRVWKHAVLALNPYWQVGNTVGNVLLATIGGAASPLDLWNYGREAYRLLREEGTTGASHFPARLYGAGATSDVMRFLEDSPEPRTPVGKVINKSYRLNEFVDDLGRSTLYMIYRDQLGMPSELAVREALKIMGDFQRMTPFERNVIRRIFPFYAWTRHMTTLTWHLAVDHPLRTAWTMHLATFTMDPEEMSAQSDRPPFLRGAIPIGDQGWYFPAANLVPYTAVATNPLYAGNVLEGMRGLNPVIQLGLNALLSVNARQGRMNTAPPGQENIDWYGRPVFGLNDLKGVGYFVANQAPTTRLLFSAVADPVVRYDTGDPIRRGGREIPIEGGQARAMFDNLGIPLPQNVDESGVMRRREQRQRQRERAQRRYDR